MNLIHCEFSAVFVFVTPPERRGTRGADAQVVHRLRGQELPHRRAQHSTAVRPAASNS